MFHGEISIDLPSRVPPSGGLAHRLVLRLMGSARTKSSDDPDEAVEELLLDGLSTYEGLLQAAGSAGFDDIISVVVDGRIVYEDTEQRMNDLSEALEGLVRHGRIEQGFGVLRVTFSRRHLGLHVLAEGKLLARASRGQRELEIRLSGWPPALDVEPNEGPREYATRVREHIGDAAALDEHLSTMCESVETLAREIERTIPGAKSSVHDVELRIVAPGPKQVARMRHLGFHQSHRSVVYRSIPAHERIGAYDDPFNLHYYSRYRDLFDWIALGEILDGHWNRSDVKVLHPTGQELFTGDRAASFDTHRLEVARDAVRVSPEGDLVIDSSVPEVPDFVPEERGTPHSPGWAGEAWAEDIADEG